jgi:hypothetical protein
VCQTDDAHGAGVALHGSRHVRHPTGVRGAHPHRRRWWSNRDASCLARRGANFSHGSRASNFHDDSPFASTPTTEISARSLRAISAS